MKKRILSIVMMLALAITLALGTAVISSAQTGDCLGADASLADNITMKVYFELDKSSFKTATAKVGVKEATDVSHKVTFDEGKGTVIVPVEVAVKDIDKTITVTVSDGTTTYTKTDFTAKSYLASVTGEYSAIANMLIAYGDTAKAYFDAPDTLTAPDEAPAFGDSAIKVSGTIPAGLKHRSATLFIESATTIRHYFETTDGFKSIDNYTFYVDYDNDGGYDKNEVLIPMQIGDRYCVDIAGITPNDIDREYTVYVTDNTTTYSCTYSAVIYAKRTYEKEDATAAQKALSATLYNYFAAANDIGANIIFKNGTETLNTVKYNYGVDNYISYFPTSTDAAAFAGWYFDEALTKPANCIEAGKTGDVTIYGKFSETLIANNANGQAFSNAIKNHDAVKSTVTNGNLTITTDADGNTTYDYSSFSALGKRFSVGWSSGGQLNYSLTQQTTETKLVKFTVALGKLAGKAPIPLSFRINNNNDEFICVPPTAADDGNYYVYLGDGQSQYLTEKYRIAKLEDGKTVDVTFYADLSSCTSTEVNSGGVKESIKVYATNINNELVSIDSTADTWNRHGFQIQFGDQQMTSANNATEGNPYALIIGKFDAQPAYEASIIDATSSQTVQNYTLGQATRLPTGASKTGYDFLGWYSDAELTNKINSIPSGTSGKVKVYSKWVAATETVGAKYIDRNTSPITNNQTFDYGAAMEALDWCYSYSVTFDTSKETAKTGVAIVRQRPSGVDPATGRAWADMYQTNTEEKALAKAADIKTKYNIDVTTEEGMAEYLEMNKKFNPNNHNINALRYNKGVVSTLNNKALANVLETNARISYVCDFKNLEIRYYVDSEYVCTENISANLPFLEADGGLAYYGPYTNSVSFRFFNWQCSGEAEAVDLLDSAITMGDIYTANKVNYYTDDGTVIKDEEGTYSLAITPGSALTLPENAVNADGVAILGWYTDAAFTKPAEDYVGEVAKSVTLYAKHPKKVNLTYEAASGTLAGTADTDYTTAYYAGLQTVTLPTATKSGATFLGWYLDSEFTVSATAENLAKLITDTTVYARWSDKTAVWDKENLTPGTNDTFVNEYNLGNDMKTAETNIFTLRIDTATSGSIGWDLNTNRDDNNAIRLRNGWAAGTNTNGECRVIYFANGNMTTFTGVVLTAMNSGDVVDLVFDIAAKTITYYVNGEFKITETANTLNNHMMFDSIDAYNSGEGYTEAGYTRTRSSLFQVTQLAGRKLAYDFCGAYVGNLYG